jgi:hypothetical protein
MGVLFLPFVVRSFITAYQIEPRGFQRTGHKAKVRREGRVRDIADRVGSGWRKEQERGGSHNREASFPHVILTRVLPYSGAGELASKYSATPS